MCIAVACLRMDIPYPGKQGWKEGLGNHAHISCRADMQVQRLDLQTCWIREIEKGGGAEEEDMMEREGHTLCLKLVY